MVISCCNLSIGMPFIILCGYPCSGKTSRSLELKDYFENTKRRRTVIVTEHNRGLQRNSLYSGTVNVIDLCHRKLLFSLSLVLLYIFGHE